MPTTLSDDPKEAVNHPRHYNLHPSGVEAIEVIEEYSANLALALKHLWRDGKKDVPPLEDLKKAAWYLEREARRLRKMLTTDGHQELVRRVVQSDPGLLGSVLNQLMMDPAEVSFEDVEAALELVHEEIGRTLNP